MSLLEVKSLTVRYGGVTAVDSVDLRVESGELVGLIGPNGAGKTSLIDAITGFTAARGETLFDGRSITGDRPHARVRRGLSRTFQSLELFEDMTVGENLAVAAEQPRWWSVTDRYRCAAGATLGEGIGAIRVVGRRAQRPDRFAADQPAQRRSQTRSVSAGVGDESASGAPR